MNLGSLKLGKGIVIDWVEHAIDMTVAHAEPQLIKWSGDGHKCFILFPLSPTPFYNNGVPDSAKHRLGAGDLRFRSASLGQTFCHTPRL